MAVMDATSGRVLGTAPIGGGADGAGYDPGARLAFASCGDGVLMVIAQETAGAPKVAQSLPTQPGARTMTLDERTHRIFLVTSDFGDAPAPTPEHPRPRRSIVPGTSGCWSWTIHREDHERRRRQKSMKARFWRRVATVSVVLATTAAQAGAASQEASNRLAREIYAQLIEINTTDSVGNVTTAAEAMAKRFRAAGFPAADVQLLGPRENKKNLVVRLRGTGAHKPVLLLGHLDVVEAPREDWATDPFKLVEKDGYLRPRHDRHEEWGRHYGGDALADEAGRLSAGAGHHSGADRR
jgi:hypothetical protein